VLKHKGKKQRLGVYTQPQTISFNYSAMKCDPQTNVSAQKNAKSVILEVSNLYSVLPLSLSSPFLRHHSFTVFMIRISFLMFQTFSSSNKTPSFPPKLYWIYV
jgi:hypothetical protein